MRCACWKNRPEGSGLKCVKKNEAVPADRIACADPLNPCKHRSECIVYALWQESLRECREHEPAEGAAGLEKPGKPGGAGEKKSG